MSHRNITGSKFWLRPPGWLECGAEVLATLKRGTGSMNETLCFFAHFIVDILFLLSGVRSGVLVDYGGLSAKVVARYIDVIHV